MTIVGWWESLFKKKHKKIVKVFWLLDYYSKYENEIVLTCGLIRHGINAKKMTIWAALTWKKKRKVKININISKTNNNIERFQKCTILGNMICKHISKAVKT